MGYIGWSADMFIVVFGMGGGGENEIEIRKFEQIRSKKILSQSDTQLLEEGFMQN